MIRERCSCGAEIEVDETNPMKIVATWRRNHKCRTPVEQRDSSTLTATERQEADERSPEFHIGFRPQTEEEG
jgi:hypothetical protein